MDKLLLIEPLNTLIFKDDKQSDFIVRPNTFEFLEELSIYYKIGVWSVLKNDELERIWARLISIKFKTEFIYGYNECTQFYHDGVIEFGKRQKRLNHLGYNPESIIVIDSKIPTHENYNNVFLIKEYKGLQDDQELIEVLPELIKLKDCSNTRTIN